MPKAFDDILAGIKKSSKGTVNPRTKKPYTESELYAIATAAYKKKFGSNPMHKKEALSLQSLPKNFVIEYLAPFKIVESAKAEGSSKSIHIKGTAVDESISYNNIKYTKEELKRAAPSLVDKPILKDHENRIDSLVGRTTEAYFTENGNKVEFEGDIMDATAIEMLQDGRIKNVSIGAKVDKLVREKPNDMNSPLLTEGLMFLELSLVPVQGVKNATISQAIFEKLGDGIMVEEEKEEEPESESESVPETKTEAVDAKKDSTQNEAMDLVLKEVKALREEVKSLKEKPKGKGVVSTTAQEIAPRDELIRERTKDGVSIFGVSEELIYGKREKR